MKTRNKLRTITRWLVLAILLPPMVSVAMEPDQLELDPVVVDVVEMLKAGVDEGAIVQWLESTDRQPTDISRQGMIALTGAGATERLITSLLQRVDAPGPELTETGALPADGSARRRVEAGQESAEATFSLRAKQAFVDEDEPDSPREPPWSVYLYLDGELIAWTRPSVKGEPVETRRMIDAGRRELRVVLQRYEDQRGGWLHESLSVPTLVDFEVLPGNSVDVEVKMNRIWGLWREKKDGGPLSYLIRQGVDVLAENQGTGGNPDRWQPVCEDVEANFPDAQGVPKRFRNQMGRCIRWSKLWTAGGQSTSRSEILGDLAEYDFQPSVD